MAKTSYWADNYIQKKTSVHEAISLIKPGQRVFLGSSCGEPQYLVQELSEAAVNLTDLEIIRLLAMEKIPLVAISGYPSSALWVRVFSEHFIPEVNRLLAQGNQYEIEWNTPFGSVTGPGGALESIQYDLADIGVITTAFHSDKIPFFTAISCA